MYASYIGHDNIVNLLLEAGVNVNAATAKGLTPLMLAASCGNESIAYFLLQVQRQVASLKKSTVGFPIWFSFPKPEARRGVGAQGL